jgi:3-hydroxy-D-aspartate aldolase
MTLGEIATPALILDLPAFEANLAAMRQACAARGVRLRAHGKAHKTPELARRQIADGGSAGICAQKVAEAEAFVRAGIDDVLVANEVVADGTIDRLARLSATARMAVCVDDATVVPRLGAAVRRHGGTLGVVVEIDVGAGRCGVSPGTPAADLAATVAAEPGLRFAGLQAYHGAAQHLRTPDERAAAIARAVDLVRQSLAALERRGIPCPDVTGAGTGTFTLEAASGVYTEVQAGSYAFMDADYARNTPAEDAPAFAHALFVLATVMSTAGSGRAVVDAGHKAASIDTGLPVVHGRPEIAYVGASDEHGVVTDPASTLRLGDRLLLIPGHCDPTFNLHDHVVAVREGRVEAVFAVAARGKGW